VSSGVRSNKRGPHCPGAGTARRSHRGIGASAGGLEAFTELLANLPARPAWRSCSSSTRPNHKAALGILSRTTRCPSGSDGGRRGGGRSVYSSRPPHRLSGTAWPDPRPAGRGRTCPPTICSARWRPPRARGPSASSCRGAAPTDAGLPDHPRPRAAHLRPGRALGQAKQHAPQRRRRRHVDHVMSPRDIARNSCGSTATYTGRPPRTGRALRKPTRLSGRAAPWPLDAPLDLVCLYG